MVWAQLRALVGTTADPALAGFPWLEALLGGTGPQAERGAVVEACRFHGLALPVFGLPRPGSPGTLSCMGYPTPPICPWS